MKNVYYYVKVGLERITPAGLLVKARNMVSQITGNASFTAPVPKLVDVTDAADKLEGAINAYELNPGPGEHLARELAFGKVKGLVSDLGGYVQAASNGDLEAIKSAGCAVRKSPEPFGLLPAPLGVTARTTAYPGVLDVRWKGVKGRSMYELESCMGDPTEPANWSVVSLTSKNRYIAEGLKSNEVYYFRVKALGAAGASPLSDSAHAKAA